MSKRRKILGKEKNRDGDWRWIAVGIEHMGNKAERSTDYRSFHLDNLIGKQSEDSKYTSILECTQAQFYRMDPYISSSGLEETYYSVTTNREYPTNISKGYLTRLMASPSVICTFVHCYRGSLSYDNDKISFPVVQDLTDLGKNGVRIYKPLLCLHAHFARNVNFEDILFRQACIRLRVRTVWIDTFEYVNKQLG